MEQNWQEAAPIPTYPFPTYSHTANGADSRPCILNSFEARILDAFPPVLHRLSPA